MTAPATTDVPDDTLTLADIRGENYPAPNAQKIGTAGGVVTDYVQRLMRITEPWAQMKYRLSARNLLMADGRQRIDWSKGRNQWIDLPTLEGEVVTVINYIKPILRSLAQRVLSADFRWKVTPRTNAHDERDRATVAETLLDSRYRKTDMDGKVRLALYLAYNCGVAYLKSFWNPNIGPQQTASVTLPHPVSGAPTEYPVARTGLPLMDEEGNPDPSAQAFVYRPGDTDTAVRSIFNIRLNPDAQGLEPDEGFRWLLDYDLLPISTIKERWGVVAKDVTGANQTDSLSLQFQRLVAALGPTFYGVSPMPMDGAAEPQALYVEYWEEKSSLLPQGRLVVMAGTVLLYDGPLPQGFIPHTAIYDERRPFDATGRARVDDLIPPQLTLNAEVSALLTQNKRDGIGQWMGFDIPGLFDQIGNVTAAHIKVPLRGQALNRSLGDLVAKVPPTPVNQARIAAIEMAQRQMFDIGAYHEIQRGQVPPGVDSGVAVQLLQEAENAQLNDTVRQLQLSLIRWGRQQGGLAKWGYGDEEERWLPAGDESLDFLVEAVGGMDLPDFEEIDLSLEGFQPTSVAAQRAEIFQALEMQMIDPGEARDLLDIGRGLKGAYASQKRQYQKARRENLAIERGEFHVIPAPALAPTEGGAAFLHPDGSPFLLPSLDDHQQHIRVHEEIALDNTKPWPLVQAMLLHIAEHQTVMQQNAAQMMALQTVSDPKRPLALPPGPAAPSGQPTEEAPQ